MNNKYDGYSFIVIILLMISTWYYWNKSRVNDSESINSISIAVGFRAGCEISKDLHEKLLLKVVYKETHPQLIEWFQMVKNWCGEKGAIFGVEQAALWTKNPNLERQALIRERENYCIKQEDIKKIYNDDLVCRRLK